MNETTSLNKKYKKYSDDEEQQQVEDAYDYGYGEYNDVYHLAPLQDISFMP